MPAGDWGNSLFQAVSTALGNLIAAIPALIGALLVLAVGWWLSGILARLARTVLDRAGADRLYAEHGGRDLYAGAAEAIVPSRVGGELVKWLVRLVFLVAAANVLGLTQVSILLNQVILWIPNLAVAAVILLIAPLIGRFLRGLIQVGAGQMGFTNAALLGRIAEFAVIAFAVLVAINQIGIAANLVNILFIGVVAALALAFGLAFGLGGRDVAAQLTRDWYERGRETAGRVRDDGTSGATAADTAGLPMAPAAVAPAASGMEAPTSPTTGTPPRRAGVGRAASGTRVTTGTTSEPTPAQTELPGASPAAESALPLETPPSATEPTEAGASVRPTVRSRAAPTKPGMRSSVEPSVRRQVPPRRQPPPG